MAAAPVVSAARPHLFRVRYALQLATLTAGRIRGQHTVHGSLVTSTDELRVLLADLYEAFRAQTGLMGIQILSVRRCRPATSPPLSLL